MMIACINPNERGIHIDESLIEEADEKYNQYTIDELEDSLKNKSFENYSIEENVPQISLLDMKTITETLKNRIVNV